MTQGIVVVDYIKSPLCDECTGDTHTVRVLEDRGDEIEGETLSCSFCSDFNFTIPKSRILYKKTGSVDLSPGYSWWQAWM